ELMFIVTAQLVKPVNRDDLPTMRGIDGLKKGSLLGIEPKGEGIQGSTGFSVTGQNTEPASAPTPKAPEASKPEASKSTSDETGAGSPTTTSSNSTRNI